MIYYEHTRQCIYVYSVTYIQVSEDMYVYTKSLHVHSAVK